MAWFRIVKDNEIYEVDFYPLLWLDTPVEYISRDGHWHLLWVNDLSAGVERWILTYIPDPSLSIEYVKGNILLKDLMQAGMSKLIIIFYDRETMKINFDKLPELSKDSPYMPDGNIKLELYDYYKKEVLKFMCVSK